MSVFNEIGSGAKLDRIERRNVMALAQRREIDAVLVTELSRWGRSTLDLLHTLKQLETWRVSVIAMNGLAFDWRRRTAACWPPHRWHRGVRARTIQERIAGVAAAKAWGSESGASQGSGRNPTASRLKCSHSCARAAAIG